MHYSLNVLKQKNIVILCVGLNVTHIVLNLVSIYGVLKNLLILFLRLQALFMVLVLVSVLLSILPIIGIMSVVLFVILKLQIMERNDFMNKYFKALCEAVAAFVGSLLGVSIDKLF